MPKSNKTTLWYAVNMCLACMCEICQYLSAILEVAENKPQEIIDRLTQMQMACSASMNMHALNLSDNELEKAGIPVPNNGQGLS